MALTVKFSIDLSSDGVTLTVTDKTGAYSGTNQGGFGSPNPLVSEAAVATFKIAKRNSDGTFGTETSVNVFDDTTPLPSDAGGSTTITATQAAQGLSYPDAIYRMIYTVSGTSGGTPFSASSTQHKVLRNSIATCYQKKSAELSDCSCACDDIEESFKCFSIYVRLLKAAECCGNLNAIQKYLDKLTELCSDNSCC